ncbi:MAG: polymer-forming cytoskeletal protein [Leptospira sp.]|jgi:cytoskeletal protein CcmA (bactofilin family)|nr:polymer-forming cytoskeletal protein [Leptospira sp.]MCZ8342220.1 polymer-forming cytoskeletal protein [Leptospira sp.]
MSKKVMVPTITEHGVIATILGKETAFNGTLAFKKPLQISGDFTGEIISEGYLVISEGARVKANIKAGTVVVGGTIIGNVTATQRLEMLSTGKVQGNIRTSKLQIADGVVFDGNCEMLSNEET